MLYSAPGSKIRASAPNVIRELRFGLAARYAKGYLLSMLSSQLPSDTPYCGVANPRGKMVPEVLEAGEPELCRPLNSRVAFLPIFFVFG